MYRTSDWVTAALPLIVVFVIALILVITAVNTDAAVQRFIELAGTNQVSVVRQSSLLPFIGNPHDVTFELLVDGKSMSGRCTKSILDDMVCRLYGAGGE